MLSASAERAMCVSYAYSLNHLREAIKRIGEFLEDIKNGNVQ